MTLPHAPRLADDPPRYRAARRRSVRTALATASLIVAPVSVLSGAQFALQDINNSTPILLLSLGQAALSVGVFLAMRTRLRRYPLPVAFAYLLLVPLVPLATLQIEPASALLISASLALIPIAVALLLPGLGRCTPPGQPAIWRSSWRATRPGRRPSSGPLSAWYLLIAVGIGVTFGVFGQRRREHDDRLSFHREETLRVLVHRSAEQQRSLIRLNVELDRVLAREVLGRHSIEAALSLIDSTASPEQIAATACQEIVKLPMVNSAWVVVFAADNARILSSVGIENVPEPSVVETALLRDKAAAAPWADLIVTPIAGDQEVAWPKGVAGSIWSPLRGTNGIIGVIGCGTHDRDSAEPIAELLSAVTTYGSIVNSLVAPGLDARRAADITRARIRSIVNEGAFSPFFQPIVDLDSEQVVGYEALTRFSDGTPPNVVFDLATSAGMSVELKIATLTAAVDASRVLPATAYVGLNVSPALLDEVALRHLIAGIDRPVVIEITEHVAIDDYEHLRAAIQALGPEVRLAVDDAGAGYSSLRHIVELTPHYVKLDIGLVRGVDGDPARQALIAGVGYFASMRGMRLVAEGIETDEELATLRSLGIGFGQGYLLGRPQDGRGAAPWPTAVALKQLLRRTSRERPTLRPVPRYRRASRSTSSMVGTTSHPADLPT